MVFPLHVRTVTITDFVCDGHSCVLHWTVAYHWLLGDKAAKREEGKWTQSERGCVLLGVENRYLVCYSAYFTRVCYFSGAVKTQYFKSICNSYTTNKHLSVYSWMCSCCSFHLGKK